MTYTYRIILAVLLCCNGYLPAIAQITQVFQPNGANGKDAIIGNCLSCGYNNMNFGSADEFSVMAWTNSGNESDIRGVIAFDLTPIPSNAIVSSAKLSLYFNPNPLSGNMNSHHSTLSGSNAAYLKKVTSSWNENTVTWDNQPATTSSGQVLLPASTYDSQDYLDIDITALVQNMVNNPAQNFGLMLQLMNEDAYRGLLFASSDHANANLHPKLEVTYSTSTTGVLEYSMDNNLKIVPNPNSGSFTLSIPKEIENGVVSIIDVQGETVYSHVFGGTQQLDLDLSKGIYFIRIANEEVVYNSKMIVE